MQQEIVLPVVEAPKPFIQMDTLQQEEKQTSVTQEQTPLATVAVVDEPKVDVVVEKQKEKLPSKTLESILNSPNSLKVDLSSITFEPSTPSEPETKEAEPVATPSWFESFTGEFLKSKTQKDCALMCFSEGETCFTFCSFGKTMIENFNATFLSIRKNKLVGNTSAYSFYLGDSDPSFKNCFLEAVPRMVECTLKNVENSIDMFTAEFPNETFSIVPQLDIIITLRKPLVEKEEETLAKKEETTVVATTETPIVTPAVVTPVVKSWFSLPSIPFFSSKK